MSSAQEVLWISSRRQSVAALKRKLERWKGRTGPTGTVRLYPGRQRQKIDNEGRLQGAAQARQKFDLFGAP
jgi:hypothetical protein